MMKQGNTGCLMAMTLAAALAAVSANAPVMASGAPAAATSEPAAPYVRPDTRAFLDAMKARPKMVFTAEVLAQLRKLPAAASLASMDLPVGDLGKVQNVVMPGPGGDIQLRLFDARATRAPGPVVVFYHGGGFVLGSIGTHAGLAAEMARALDLPVVSVEYRLAPEAPWPAAPDDAEAAARWVAQNGARFGREFTGLVLSGDSAGGALTLVTALALRDKPAALPLVMQIPIYPGTDLAADYPSNRQFGDGYGLDSENMVMYRRHYGADAKSWRGSPALANVAGLPPTLLVTAGLDPLRDQGRAFAAKLIQAGVRTSYYEADGLVHGFATYRKAIPSAQRDVAAFLADAKAMLAEALAQPPRAPGS